MKNKWSFFNNYYSFKFEGLNIERVLNLLLKNNIFVFDVLRPTYKEIYFKIKYRDYKKFKNIKELNNYNFILVSKNGIPKMVECLKNNNAFFVSFIFCLCALKVLSLFTFNITIMGAENIDKQKIIKVLNNNNIKVNKINNFNNKNVENLLMENIDEISMVSVVKKGTHIVVNIKEKLHNSWIDSKGIVAPFDITIKNIQVFQGTTKYKDGDSVKKGDVIVENYIYQNGIKTKCKPVATINVTMWFSGEVLFNPNKIEYVKTGKKQINSCYFYNNKKIISTIKPVKFDNYKKDVYNEYIFKNFLLPIKLNREVYYETKPKVIKQNFSNNKKDLINLSKQIATKKVPKNIKINTMQTKIIPLNNGRIMVQTIASCIGEIVAK